MRVLIAVIVIIYFIGVGVALAPIVRANWNSETAADFAASVGHALPDALAWPANAYRSLSERG